MLLFTISEAHRLWPVDSYWFLEHLLVHEDNKSQAAGFPYIQLRNQTKYSKNSLLALLVELFCVSNCCNYLMDVMLREVRQSVWPRVGEELVRKTISIKMWSIVSKSLRTPGLFYLKLTLSQLFRSTMFRSCAHFSLTPT